MSADNAGLDLEPLFAAQPSARSKVVSLSLSQSQLPLGEACFVDEQPNGDAGRDDSQHGKGTPMKRQLRTNALAQRGRVGYRTKYKMSTLLAEFAFNRVQPVRQFLRSERCCFFV